MRALIAALAGVALLGASPSQIYEDQTPASVTALTIHGSTATFEVWRIYATMSATQHLQWKATFDGRTLHFASRRFFGACKPMRVERPATGTIRLDDGAGHTASLNQLSKPALDLAVHRLAVVKHLQAAQPLLKIPIEVAFTPACGG